MCAAIYSFHVPSGVETKYRQVARTEKYLPEECVGHQTSYDRLQDGKIMWYFVLLLKLG